MRFNITRHADKSWLFEINANDAYPIILTEMGVDGRATQYDLEFAHNVIKLDAQMFTKTCSPPVEVGKTPVFIIGGGDDPDYKEAWGVAYAPPGQHDELRDANVQEWEAKVAREAKAWYQRTRGYLPA